MTDHRDPRGNLDITPPQAVMDFHTRLAKLYEEWQSQVLIALHSSRLSEEEVRRLRAWCDMEASHIAELKEQIKTLRSERDEARRWFCQRAEWMDGSDGTQTAKEHGWDCFRESPLDRLAKLDEENGI